MVRRSYGAVLLAALVATMLIGSARPAGACSCVGLSDEAALAAADAAFSGELVEIRTPSGETFSSADPERFVFSVDRVYKGEARARQSVVTPRGGGSCGLELTGPGPFLVFASTTPVLDLEGDEGELFSHLCTGTRSLGEVAVPTSFGAGASPGPGASAVGSVDDGGAPVVLILAGVAVVLAVAGGFLVLRRARRT